MPTTFNWGKALRPIIVLFVILVATVFLAVLIPHEEGQHQVTPQQWATQESANDQKLKQITAQLQKKICDKLAKDGVYASSVKPTDLDNCLLLKNEAFLQAQCKWCNADGICNLPTAVFLTLYHQNTNQNLQCYQQFPVDGNSVTAPNQSNSYNNSFFGFSFIYPNGMDVSENLYDSKNNPPTPFGSTPVSYIVTKNANQTEGFFSVSIINDQKVVTNCSADFGNTHQGYSGTLKRKTLDRVSINGATFTRSEYEGNNETVGYERNYASAHKDLCYVLRLTVFPSACINSGCDNRLWSTYTEQSMLNQLDSIAQSFSFIQQ